MRYALIGCGRISPNHIEAARNGGLNFVAMCDIDESKIIEKSKKLELNDVHQYTDYMEMIEKFLVDVKSLYRMDELQASMMRLWRHSFEA